MQEIWMILRTTAGSPQLLLAALCDIILVSLPFFIIFSLLRESRSFMALWGIIVMLTLSFAVYLVAKMAHLEATSLIYERFWIIVVLVFLIIFQGELKKGLTDVGRLPFIRAFVRKETFVVDEIIDAVAKMADKRCGAIIGIERGTSLRPYLGTGTPLDAQISSELLRSIFVTAAPLHDGAVMVRGSRILAAGCILPLTEDPRLSKDLGTRHRAAIGLTEETDAIVIVVSEETGTISLTKEGKIERFLSPQDLRKLLERELELSESDGKDDAA